MIAVIESYVVLFYILGNSKFQTVLKISFYDKKRCE
jgi:hypothetical protein